MKKIVIGTVSFRKKDALDKQVSKSKLLVGSVDVEPALESIGSRCKYMNNPSNIFEKNVWVERDLYPGPNDSDASSLWSELYKHIKG